MKRLICLITTGLFLVPFYAHASCSLSTPILDGATQENAVDDYYGNAPIASNWQQSAAACFIGPNSFVDPATNPTVNVNTYLQEYSKSFVTGVDTPIDDNAPNASGTPASSLWTLTQRTISSGTYAGCNRGCYSVSGLIDESYNPTTFAVVAYAPAWCVYNDAVSNTCAGGHGGQNRVNATHPGELLSYEVIDTMGKSSGETASSANCIRQGPPNNTQDRGAICINTTTP